LIKNVLVGNSYSVFLFLSSATIEMKAIVKIMIMREEKRSLYHSSEDNYISQYVTSDFT